jgi:hypothetical protein
VLRRAAGKTEAAIYDFVVVPPDTDVGEWSDDSGYAVERALFSRELERINEFAQTAVNHGQALSVVLSIRKRLRLL